VISDLTGYKNLSGLTFYLLEPIIGRLSANDRSSRSFAI
jgi:hypothetical protein